MSPDWLGAARRATAAQRSMLAERRTTAQRVIETGTRGEGGDRTLEIDALAEDAVFAELAALHEQGARFTVVSEERGTVDFGGDGTLVIVDPIDGSMNAKRGLSHFCVSIAVAEGPRMADVTFGFVHDFGPDEEWVARRGAGATLNGERLDPDAGERRWRDGKLELVGFESADPRWVARTADGLERVAHRLRAMGTIAAALCQVADARFDGMLTLKGCRAVDAAAAQLVVREAGGLVAFPAFDDPLGAPLDLVPHSPVVAARTAAALAELATVPDWVM
ncbi:MAG TPA: inositol monophosphatase family protein [Solirubrobacteraceae bacterium]|nr:inositol monophosphatase family protein [Solirubrobacteraceae bacterium]